MIEGAAQDACGLLDVLVLKEAVCSLSCLREPVALGKRLAYGRRVIGNLAVDQALDRALGGCSHAGVGVVAGQVHDHANVALGGSDSLGVLAELGGNQSAHDVVGQVVPLVGLLDGEAAHAGAAQDLGLLLGDATRRQRDHLVATGRAEALL